ncbi:MAG: hypothetical protein KA533_02920 [Sphingobium sp.]|nr:hypothetical protein [Sphingobium sp.]MBP6111869.1 hypothetical protein [Sphingobium sp.]MBP8669811.1 hypothetical protein [Sphingobium sp.]MBP9156429.1 hypothetical protein [Sphingobium sp.]
METIYDWIALIAFAGLIVLFLQRSSMDEPPDTVWHYLPPAIGCALSNYLGNEGMAIPAILTLVAVGAYIVMVLKPRIPG